MVTLMVVDFKKKVWENGLFSAVNLLVVQLFSTCGTSSGSIAPGNADKFKDGFNSDYYGLWRNGIVTNIKDPNYIDNKRITDPKRDNNRVIFKKILWEKEYLTILMVRFKTLFISGSFENGLFKSSSLILMLREIMN
jgi:hypothetical protein